MTLYIERKIIVKFLARGKNIHPNCNVIYICEGFINYFKEIMSNNYQGEIESMKNADLIKQI